MSTSSLPKLPKLRGGDVTLTVHTADETTEIFVIDSQFHRVARALGETAEFKLPQGLYSVKVRTGLEYREKPVILSKDAQVTFNPIAFSSPAPLEDTAKIHEFHVGNAEIYSSQLHASLGRGSQIYLFVRDWTAKDQPSSEPSSPPLHPARGLTLRDRQGQVLADFALPSWPHDLRWDPWAACNLEVDPGSYRLYLETAAGDVLEQTIVASPGWQTQVFLLQRDYGYREPDRRADLPNASIFLSPIGWGFRPQRTGQRTPGDLDFRLAEMVRQGLANSRRVLSDTVVHTMLDGKFSNPMLGIYGAHLLLFDEKPDRQILTTVVGNLRRLLGAPHPDVEALALKLGQGSNYVFDLPPMLRRSWGFVLNASVQRPDLVPEDSLSYQIAGRLWSGEPWLLWTKSTAVGDLEKLLRAQLESLVQPDEAAASSAAAEDTPLFLTSEAIPSAGHLSMRSVTPESATRKPKPRRTAPRRELDDETATRLVQALGVPRTKLDSLLKSIDPELSAARPPSSRRRRRPSTATS